jgi:hypothetical protein
MVSWRGFTRHWAIVKGDVVAIVRKFFSDGVMPEGINDTSIVLIPKDKILRSSLISDRSAYAMSYIS